MQAAAAEPPVVTAERIDKRIEKAKAELEIAMRDRDFSACVSLQKYIEKLKDERKHIPGLSWEIESITKIQCIGRKYLARLTYHKKVFRSKLPPPPWQTHVDEHSGFEYFFEPYSNESTWDINDTVETLRAQLKAVADHKAKLEELGLDSDDELPEEKEAKENEQRGLVSPGKQQPEGTGPATSPFLGSESQRGVSQRADGSPVNGDPVSPDDMPEEEPIVWPTRPDGMVSIYLDVEWDKMRAKKLAKSAADEAKAKQRAKMAKRAERERRKEQW